MERLSPSAAAASKLLKGGITLTQIYSQLVASQASEGANWLYKSQAKTGLILGPLF